MLSTTVREFCAKKVAVALKALAAPGGSSPPRLLQQLAAAATEQAVANLDDAQLQVIVHL